MKRAAFLVYREVLFWALAFALIFGGVVLLTAVQGAWGYWASGAVLVLLLGPLVYFWFRGRNIGLSEDARALRRIEHHARWGVRPYIYAGVAVGFLLLVWFR